jgi:hypothetical protein
MIFRSCQANYERFHQPMYRPCCRSPIIARGHDITLAFGYPGLKIYRSHG